MRACPKCGAFYAADWSTFCRGDGTPLNDVAPGTDAWSQGERTIEERAQTLNKHQRRRRLRRIMLTTIALLVVARVIYVVAVKGVEHVTAEQPHTASTLPAQPVTDPSPSPSPRLSPSPTPRPSPSPSPSPLLTFRITGQVKFPNGLPPKTIHIVLRDGNKTFSAMTDAGGNYAFPTLAADHQYVITPVGDKFDFEPRRQVISILRQNERADFSAKPSRDSTDTVVYQISGRLTSATGRIPFLVRVMLGGTRSMTTTTDSEGNFSFKGLPPGDYTVTPADERVIFEPRIRAVVKLSRDERVDFLAIPRRKLIPIGPLLDLKEVPGRGPLRPRPTPRPTP